MNSSLLQCTLGARESTVFTHLCHLHGFRPEEFHISVADAVDGDNSAPVLERTFVITQISSGCRRRYPANQPSRGLEAFESDLRAGIFPLSNIDWDWIGTHRYS